MTTIPQTVEAEIEQEKPFDASDPKQVNESRKKAGRKNRERLEFIEGMMSIPQGRKWIWELMESCFIHSNPLVANDTHGTYFNLGQQNIGKRVLADVQQFPELYVRMCNEMRSRK